MFGRIWWIMSINALTYPFLLFGILNSKERDTKRSRETQILISLLGQAIPKEQGFLL